MRPLGTNPRFFKASTRLAALGLAVVLVAACGSCSSTSPEPARATGTGESHEAPAVETPPEDPVGVVERGTIVDAFPSWRTAFEAASPDAEAARALTEVDPGAEVTVYLATWCGDSRREVPRLWAALDVARTEGELPFTVRYVGVDRAKEAPGGVLEGVDLRYVPTIVVRRNGEEVGRIVESAPQGVEVALLTLLRGDAEGIITGRTDL